MKRGKTFKLEKDEEVCEEEEYYEVEKVLDTKVQAGKRYYLIKWLGWAVETSTWEEEKAVSHLKHLIRDYYNSHKFDQQNNIGIKKVDPIQVGMSPYEATKYYGHVLYGDRPLRIVAVNVVNKKNGKEAHFQVEWASRENGFKPTNSLIESSILIEHVPSFLIDFYQSKTRLLVPES